LSVVGLGRVSSAPNDHGKRGAYLIEPQSVNGLSDLTMFLHVPVFHAQGFDAAGKAALAEAKRIFSVSTSDGSAVVRHRYAGRWKILEVQSPIPNLKCFSNRSGGPTGF
jgi:hypothetical protein